MEIKINKEIRNYTESMFFGLSMRQFFFAVIGAPASVELIIRRAPLLLVFAAIIVLAVRPDQAQTIVEAAADSLRENSNTIVWVTIANSK